MGGSGSFFAPILHLWCMFAGNTVLAAVLAGVAMVGLIILFIVDEGSGYISTVLRIVFGAMLLIFLPSLIVAVFPAASSVITCSGSGGGIFGP